MDTTFRDGLQSPLWYDTGVHTFLLSEKIQLFEGLLKLGIKHFEFFSPVVGSKESSDFLALKKFAEEQGYKVQFHAHCRCTEKDISQALEYGFDSLNLYMGTSDFSVKATHGKSLEEVADTALRIISSLRKNYPKLWIRFSGEDAFRTEIKNLQKVYRPLAKYLNALGTPDTVGIATPQMVEQRLSTLKKSFPKIDIECHFHNDRGFSLINSITAVKAGAKYIDCSVWGLAERSGITSTTGLLLNLYEENPTYVAGYNLQMCYPVNTTLAGTLRRQVPSTEPVSLTNRTHIAGVHQNAVSKDKNVYEAHSLEKFGVTEQQLILNHLIGVNTIYYYLKEIENYQISKEQATEIALEFKKRTHEISKTKNAKKLLLSIVKKSGVPKLLLDDSLLKKRSENLQG